MAKVRVVMHPEGLAYFLKQNKPVRDLMVSTGRAVADNAAATASDAELGEGGKLTGYAAAGFDVQWEGRSMVPRVNIRSLADAYMALRVQLSTQKRWGVMHLRRALYSVTGRGG